MSTLKADTIVAADGTSPVTLTKQSAAKAWVNIQGGGTPASQDSLNVASLTDSNTGEVFINFSNSFSNNDFAESVSGQITGTAGTGLYYTQSVATVTRTTGLSRINHYENGTGTDPSCYQSIIHGDLA